MPAPMMTSLDMARQGQLRARMQDTVRQMLHWFAENEVRPLALEADRTHQIPLEFLQKVKDLGIEARE